MALNLRRSRCEPLVLRVRCVGVERRQICRRGTLIELHRPGRAARVHEIKRGYELSAIEQELPAMLRDGAGDPAPRAHLG